jgi:polysaccharide biosynthesis/export protein
MKNYKNILTYLIIGLLVFPVVDLFPQEINLEEFKQLQDGIKDRDKNSPNLPNDEFEDEEELELRKIKDQRLKELEDKALRDRPKDFLISSQPKQMYEDVKRFGYDLFIDSPTTFAPATEIPIPSDYIIGPGDNLKIIMFGKQADEMTLQVTRTGQVFFPEIGPIYIAGLTFSKAQEIIEKKIATQMIGVQVNITLGALRSIQVFILGEVFQPGSYTVSSLSSLTNALFSSGGIKASGSLRNIQLKRNGKIITIYDFYDLLLKGDTSKDIRIEPGDVIFVPPIAKTVGITGEVYRPAIYELKEGESLNDLIYFGGGLLPGAQLSSAELESVSIIDDAYTLKAINLGSFDNNILSNGDMLYIYPVLNTINKAVLISGFAQRPGFYAWNESLKLSDIINSKEKLLPLTDVSYILIKRESNNAGDYISYQLDLNKALGNTDSDTDFILENRDEIFLFSRISQDETTTKNEINNTTKELLDIDTQNELIIIKNGSVQVINRTDWQYYRDLGYVQAEYFENPSDKKVLDSGSQFLVVKNNSVAIISQEDWPTYKTEGYVKADQTSELDAMENKIGVRSGDRQTILAKYIKLLKQQSDFQTLSKIIRIGGNVAFPGEYPLTIGMDFDDAIKAAGGFKDRSYLSEVEISRNIKRDKEYQTYRFTKSVKDLSIEDEILMAGDTITVKEMRAEMRMVKITGEVFFPGEYLLKSDDTLSQLIVRAGGLKNEAFLAGSVFQRESLRQSNIERFIKSQVELKRELILAQAKAGGVGESNTEKDIAPILSMIEDVDEDSVVGRLVLDLDALLSNKIEDVMLEDGDSLHIPKIKQSISVIGEVFVPSSHLFSTSNSLQDYLKLSGGLKNTADVKNVYVIKANGSILSGKMDGGFFRDNNNNIQPGDTVVVPVDIGQYSTLKAATDVTQIIYQMAIAAAAVNSF